MTMAMMWAYLALSLTLLTPPLHAYCPVVICPGFGNDSIDYDTPLQQPKEVGLISVLQRRGFDQISTVPVKRGDWIRVAGGLLDIPNFYTGKAQPDGFGYGWYLDRLKKSVEEAYEESGGERVLLIGHSAGGWLARAAMGDGEWVSDTKTRDRIRGLVSLGAIHKIPEEGTSCVTRGALQYTDSRYPGAYLDDIAYVSVGGAAITGDNRKDVELETAADELYSKRGEGSAARVAFTSYEAVCGNGNMIGDGVVPLEWTQLEGARQIELEGVLHSINEAGTTIPTDRWYGSEKVIDRWLPAVLEETGLSKRQSNAFSGVKNWASNLVGSSILESRRNLIITGMSLVTLRTIVPPALAMYENAPIADTGPTKLQSGVSYQDLRAGDGPQVLQDKRVNIQWVLKRSNGYTIDSSMNHDGVPFIFVVGDQTAIAGLDEGIRGMRVGGIRRIVIPPALAYVQGLEEGMQGPIPPDFGPKQRIRRVMNMLKDDVPGESFVLDVKATRVQ